MVRRGMGVVVHYEQITKETMRNALHFALNPKTQMNAKIVSHSFNNRLRNPLDTAVWWVEHVASTKGARLTHSNSVYMSGVAYHLFDVYAVISLSVLTLIFSWISVIYWFCCRTKSNYDDRKLKRQ